jgi:hypothetical protein
MRLLAFYFMIKRPLNERFTEAVLAGRKITTIREKEWPVGVPIMLYNWSGKPYRSKQINVAAVKVTGFWTIEIAHRSDGVMLYAYGMENERPLYDTEGFASREEIDDWFRAVVPVGHLVSKRLMRFSLANTEITNREATPPKP